jgi:hypothetical protein
LGLPGGDPSSDGGDAGVDDLNLGAVMAEAEPLVVVTETEEAVEAPAEKPKKRKKAKTSEDE